MWRQAVLRIWIKNKGLPLCWKIPTVLLMISGGIFLKDFPCTIVLALGVPFMEGEMDVTFSPVEDFLPKTARQRKGLDARESILLAGIYTFALILGYVLWFCRNEGYPWKGETIFFLVKVTVFMFLIFFNMRMWFIYAMLSLLEKSTYLFDGDVRAWERRAKRGTAELYGGIYFSYGSLFYLFFYTLGMFNNIKRFKFLVESQWKFAYVIGGIILILLCLQTAWIWRQKYEC